MGSWLNGLEQKKKIQEEQAKTRSEHLIRNWDLEHEEIKYAYKNNEKKINAIYDNINSIVFRVRKAVGKENVDADKSLYSIKIGDALPNDKSRQGDSSSRRITITPKRNNKFEIEFYRWNTIWERQKSFISIKKVTNGHIESWVRWVSTGHGCLLPMHKIALTIIFVILLIMVLIRI